MDVNPVMSVRHMIDSALGQIDENRVNFKLVQMILHILAQQQNILTRFVELRSVHDAPPEGGMIKVTEITAKQSTKDHHKQKHKSKSKEEELKLSLSKYEENNEHVLRVINQGTDSKTEIDPHPAPMVSPVISEATLSAHGFLVETFQKFVPAYRGPVIDREGGGTGEGTLPSGQLNWIIDAIKEIQEKLHITPKDAPSTITNAKSAITKDDSEFKPADAVFSTKDKHVSELEHRMAHLEEEVDTLKQNSDSKSQAQLAATTADTVNKLEESLEKSKAAFEKQITEMESQLLNLGSKIGTKMAMLEVLVENMKSVPERMERTESAIHTFTQQMNSFDAGISTQITALHEQISEVKNEVEEVAASINDAGASSDAAVLAEMNVRLIALANDVDIINVNQKQFFDEQTRAATNQLALIDQLESMKTSKADKDEVEDALRDKAEMKHLNGLVPLAYFEAVRLDSEKRIDQNASRLAMQEMIWQKAMEELQNNINTKSSLMELEALGYHVDDHLRAIKEQIQCIQEILGEPQAALAKRQLFKVFECASCGTKAPPQSAPGLSMPESTPLKPKFQPKKQPQPDYMLLEEKPPIPTGPAPYPDELICYKGQPRPKARTDIRSHYCQRYCGGSHTIIGPNVKRTAPELKVTELPTRQYQGVGYDGKTYQMAEPIPLQPCVPCNIRPQPLLPAPKQSALSNVAGGDNDLKIESTHLSKSSASEHHKTSQDIQSVILSVKAEPINHIKPTLSDHALAHNAIASIIKRVSDTSVGVSQHDAVSVISARHIKIADDKDVVMDNTESPHKDPVNEGED